MIYYHKIFIELLEPQKDELPSLFADKLGLAYTDLVTLAHKKELGQYFTPRQVACFMAKQVSLNQNKVKILDPGCGIGILSCTLIEELVSTPSKVKEIELFAFETDIEIIPSTEACLNYLRIWLKGKRIGFTYVIAKNDFILANSKVLNNNQEDEGNLFDVVITNPPYFKIRKDDERAIASKTIIHGQTNIYSIFLMLSAKLLKQNGKLIFITPRSFASGNYFRLFREKFFSNIHIDFVHIFDSRKEAFQRDNVLQESIIIYGTRQDLNPNQLTFPFEDKRVVNTIISNSSGIADLDKSIKRVYDINELIDLKSKNQILYIPTSEIEVNIINTFKAWNNNLTGLGYDVSTGPVVAFRSRDNIAPEPSEQTLPLIWLHNVSKMVFSWPIDRKGKEQYIKFTKATVPILLPNKNYVLIRRFSSKDDKRRLIASPYFSKYFSDYNYIGIENHLNYVYKFLGELDELELLGISGLLNSTAFDIYFRTFNGNINVSASDLKNIPFPETDAIKKIGLLIKDKGLGKVSQAFIDEQVNLLLDIKI